jgi:hypothetical protein
LNYYQNNDYLRYNYPNSYYQNQQQFNPNQQYNQINQNQSSNGIIWVQGESGAKSYLVAPNCTVQLWDSESQTIYIKSADASGMPSIKILDYTIRDDQKQKTNENTNQVNVNNNSDLEIEINGLNEKIEIMEKEINQLKNILSSKSNQNKKRGDNSK